MPAVSDLEQRMARRLDRLYGPERGPQTARALLELLRQERPQGPALAHGGERRLALDQRHCVLITYGDSVRRAGEPGLRTLAELWEQRLRGLFSTVHLLPFFPYSSDDGFAVLDFAAVDPALGSWDDVARLGQSVELAFDFVLNHLSSQSRWLQAYLAGEPGFEQLALCPAADWDLCHVVRPRESPLLTSFARADGSPVRLWTTFSADQVDLNYAEPQVLLRMVQVLLDYVRRGARLLRLDAVAFLWKEPGTSCLHLPQTHEVVRLLRDILDWVAPEVLLLTETNVPHADNVSYFGAGHDEAQLVYNFSLPPLLLHALHRGDGRQLSRWAATLETPSAGTAFFNFTASHDGIGVRPLEGLVPAEVTDELVQLCQRRGGQVSQRSGPGGRAVPYELNVSWVDALRGSDAPAGDGHHAARVLASQAVALSLPGVPAIYIHTLLGSRNYCAGVRELGAARAINREKLQLERVLAELARPTSLRAQIFSGLCRLLRLRREQPALGPLASAQVLQLDRRALVLERRSAEQRLLCLINLSAESLRLALPAPWTGARDLVTQRTMQAGACPLAPYAVAWLEA